MVLNTCCSPIIMECGADVLYAVTVPSSIRNYTEEEPQSLPYHRPIWSVDALAVVLIHTWADYVIKNFVSSSQQRIITSFFYEIYSTISQSTNNNYELIVCRRPQLWFVLSSTTLGYMCEPQSDLDSDQMWTQMSVLHQNRVSEWLSILSLRYLSACNSKTVLAVAERRIESTTDLPGNIQPMCLNPACPLLVGELFFSDKQAQVSIIQIRHFSCCKFKEKPMSEGLLKFVEFLLIWWVSC